MSNIIGIKGGKPEHVDRFFLVFTFNDGEVKAFEGDYVGHDVQYPPIMVVLTGPEETQRPVAAVNSDAVKYVQYIPKGQVEVMADGSIQYPDAGVIQEADEGEPWNAGYV